MSRRIENHCVDCGLPCLGSSCPYRNVPVDYCDDCGDEGAKYHFLAWTQIADELNIPFTKENNELLKGVSRLRSLEIILELGHHTMTNSEQDFYCTKKNDIYLEYINTLKQEDVLPGVRSFLTAARVAHIPTALGSASKNATLILDKLHLTDMFDIIIDGTLVSTAKPDPEVFLKGATSLSISPEHCVVFEDSSAGIEAAHRGNMKAIGVGDKEYLPEADQWISGFDGLMPEDILKMLKND